MSTKLPVLQEPVRNPPSGVPDTSFSKGGEKPSILEEAKLLEFLTERGHKPYRVGQIHQAIFQNLVKDFDGITTLPEDLREELKANFRFFSLAEWKTQKSTVDATTKALFKTWDGRFIESVLMRHLSGRNTVCVSSQVGCPLACTFCATGKLGFHRNLEAHEIVDQILFFERLLKAEQGVAPLAPKAHKGGQGGFGGVRNVVFMGMGEPMLNYVNVIAAIKMLNDPKKLAKGARHITISTSGLISGIEKLTEEGIQVKLAISLHAPNDALRSELMPINRRYHLVDLMKSLDNYVEKTNKRIFYEYVMLRNVNDKDEHAHELGALLKDRLAHVNLIPWNAVKGSPYELTPREVIRSFQTILETYGVPSTVRVTLGLDIDAACGQLAEKGQSWSDAQVATMA